jgi:hypothetical protein
MVKAVPNVAHTITLCANVDIYQTRKPEFCSLLNMVKQLSFKKQAVTKVLLGPSFNSRNKMSTIMNSVIHRNTGMPKSPLTSWAWKHWTNLKQNIISTDNS